MSTDTPQVTPKSSVGSLDYLEEHIVQHPKKESFMNTPVFLVLYFVLVLIFGGFLGVYLAL